MKPCQHELTSWQCRICYLYETDKRYRDLWDGSQVTAKRPPLSCGHLDPTTTRLKECSTCQGKVHLKVFVCAHPNHMMETTDAECQACPDYKEKK